MKLTVNSPTSFDPSGKLSIALSIIITSASPVSGRSGNAEGMEAKKQAKALTAPKTRLRLKKKPQKMEINLMGKTEREVFFLNFFFIPTITPCV